MMTVDEAMNHAQSELECAFEKWLTDECPSGDCESVESQWNESFVHQELVDELQPVMVLTWEVRRLRDENERLRENAKIIYELEQLAARSNNDLLVENERLRNIERAAQWYVDNPNSQRMAISQIKAAIDAARGEK